MNRKQIRRKCSKLSEDVTKDSLVETVCSEMKLRLQQKNHQTAMPSKFFWVIAV